jgi:hypothetical protein
MDYSIEPESIADIGIKGDLVKIKEHITKSKKDINFLFKVTAKYGHIEAVKYLVENGADIKTSDNFALRFAANNGQLEVVKYLVEQGADIHSYNEEALYLASVNKHIEVVRYLKGIYLKRFKKKFLCYNCIVLPMCLDFCDPLIVKPGIFTIERRMNWRSAGRRF